MKSLKHQDLKRRKEGRAGRHVGWANAAPKRCFLWHVVCLLWFLGYTYSMCCGFNFSWFLFDHSCHLLFRWSRLWVQGKTLVLSHEKTSRERKNFERRVLRENTVFFFSLWTKLSFCFGGLITLFHCSIPRKRFGSYHHTRETLRGVCLCTLFSSQLSTTLSRKTEVFRFRFLR